MLPNKNDPQYRQNDCEGHSRSVYPDSRARNREMRQTQEQICAPPKLQSWCENAVDPQRDRSRIDGSDTGSVINGPTELAEWHVKPRTRPIGEISIRKTQAPFN